MKISDAFPSKYLKASDFPDDAHTRVTIDHVETASMSQEDPEDVKPVLFFKNYHKGMVCNKTNGSIIAQKYGDEMDDWAGKEVLIYIGTFTMEGRTGPCLKIKVPTTAKSASTTSPAPLVPGGSDPKYAMKRAWDDFTTKTHSLNQSERKLAWLQMLQDYMPGTDHQKMSAEAWDAVSQRVRNEYGELPASSVLQDADIPF